MLVTGDFKGLVSEIEGKFDPELVLDWSKKELGVLICGVLDALLLNEFDGGGFNAADNFKSLTSIDGVRL